MRIRKLLYISAIPLLLIVSCAKDIEQQQVLSETGEKTPLAMDISIKDGYNQMQTKALDDSFEQNDELKAYVQQVQSDGATPPVYSSCISKLVSFTVGVAGTSVTTDNLGTTLYWDDFSSTTQDIRGDDRFLRVGYGFCFNGGTFDTGLTGTNETDGKIQGWTIQKNQTTDARANVKKSDLLWAGPQEVIKYSHDRAAQEVLPVVYTHAMSKLTVEVRLGDGYTVDAYGKAVAFGSNSTTPTVYVNTKCDEVNAVSQTISTNVSSGDDAKVQMYLLDNEATANKVRVYEAIIAPTVMKAGNKIAEVTVGGNTYEIKLTHDMMSTGFENGTAWTTKLKAYTEASGKVEQTSGDYTQATGGITLPGVNYKLVVNLQKQKISVSATITDWTTVTAAGTGAIQFINDVTETGTIADDLKSGGFDVYKSSSTSFATKSTTVKWDTTNSKWVYDPVIYWAGQSDASYFRALSPAGTTTSVSQGSDILWGTSGSTAIQPRTGDVPLSFEHALSKITVNLTTGSGDDKVDLTDAKISIASIYDGGTISIADGSISSLTASSSMPIANQTAISGYPVIPQSLVSTSDGTARTGEVTFYIPDDLTTIYNNNTSISDGSTGKTYVTSTLVKVDYTADEAKDYNAKLSGAVKEGDVKEAARTYTLDEYNALGTKPHASITQEQFDALSAEARLKTAAVLYTYDEFKALESLTAEQFAALPNELRGDATDVTAYNNLTTKPHTTMSEEQFNALSETARTKTAAVYYTLSEFQALTELTQVQLDELPNDLKTKAAVNYTAAEAITYNSALPGAVKAGDFKNYRLKTSSEGTSTQANVGDVKSAGDNPVILLHIVLADNTAYTLNLSTCKDGDGNAITAWTRGKSYTYTITLGKEQITFRALVKDWVEASGGGNANLDWD